MGSDAPVCPGCGGELAGTVDGQAHSRHYVCQRCGGWVVAIAVLRKLVVDGVADHLWTGDEEREGMVGPCAFCHRQMSARRAPAGQAAICKTCQVVWLDRTALAALPAAASAATPAQTGQQHETRCENCGAFISSPYAEKCAYCGAALTPPTQVVVVPVESQKHSSDWLGDAAVVAYGVGRVVQGAASLLDWFQQ